MKKMSEIMEELGFRPEGSDEVKKAFVKNLIKQAHEAEFKRPKNVDVVEEQNKTAEKFEQISLFDFNQKKLG